MEFINAEDVHTLLDDTIRKFEAQAEDRATTCDDQPLTTIPDDAYDGKQDNHQDILELLKASQSAIGASDEVYAGAIECIRLILRHEADEFHMVEGGILDYYVQTEDWRVLAVLQAASSLSRKHPDTKRKYDAAYPIMCGYYDRVKAMLSDSLMNPSDELVSLLNREYDATQRDERRGNDRLTSSDGVGIDGFDSHAINPVDSCLSFPLNDGTMRSILQDIGFHLY